MLVLVDWDALLLYCRFFAEACAVLACQVFGSRERSADAAKATPEGTLVVRTYPTGRICISLYMCMTWSQTSD